MSFITPKWDSVNSHYIIDVSPTLRDSTHVDVTRDVVGSTVFSDTDAVNQVASEVLATLISEGDANKWFTKLPSHAQLMKRVSHTFSSLASALNNMAFIQTILMTPKTLTFVWTPTTVKSSTQPQLSFEDSEGEELESQPDLTESNLPPVSLKSDVKQTQEEYLLTRLRAARARVEAEQIKMEYFETTGKMPPESETEDEENYEEEE